jgi:hypothetical protein
MDRVDVVRFGQSYEICSGRGMIVVTKFNKRSWFNVDWSVQFLLPDNEYIQLSGDNSVASQWITTAIAKATQCDKILDNGDPVLFKDRPALWDFMSELVGPTGQGRDPSVLMIALSAVGVRAGLKDDDAGGWLWREAQTLATALNAIEKALQAGNVQWSIPSGKGKNKR